MLKDPPPYAGEVRDRVRFLGWVDALEEGVETYSSNLAWKMLWTVEPGRLWCPRLQSRAQLKQLSMAQLGWVSWFVPLILRVNKRLSGGLLIS